jgi:hypothetical protein
MRPRVAFRRLEGGKVWEVRRVAEEPAAKFNGRFALVATQDVEQFQHRAPELGQLGPVETAGADKVLSPQLSTGADSALRGSSSFLIMLKEADRQMSRVGTETCMPRDGHT